MRNGAGGGGGGHPAGGTAQAVGILAHKVQSLNAGEAALHPSKGICQLPRRILSVCHVSIITLRVPHTPGSFPCLKFDDRHAAC